MAHDHDKKTDQAHVRKPVNADEPAHPDTGEGFDDRRGNRRGLFQRFGQRFQEQVEASRGGADFDDEEPLITDPAAIVRPVATPAQPAVVSSRTHPQPQPQPRVEESAFRRAKEAPKAVRMLIPEGVVITGSVTSPADAEISGKVDGDVTIEGILFLGATALVSGNVKAASCRVEGLVAGKVECGSELEIGESGRLNADASAGKRVTLAGEVTGNISTSGLLRLLPSAKIMGDIRARSFVIEEGAFFNGKCSMRLPAEKQTQPAPVAPKDAKEIKE